MEEVARYWLSPPELDPYRVGRFDPFPFPRPVDWDALTMTWPKPWYANPPFREGSTACVRKAISEGGPGNLILPVPLKIALLVDAKARFTYLGRVPWLECDTKEPMPNPVPCLLAELP